MADTTTINRRSPATEYAARRRRAIAYGTWQPDLVDAEPARQHLRALSAAGVGYARTAQLAGVPNSVITKLIWGDGGAPSARIRTATEAKLLSVTADQLADRASVPAIGTIRRMRALATIGWTFSAQATAIGWDVRNLHRIFTRSDYVTVATARTVAELYDRWSMTTPEPRYSTSRARGAAARSRWLPPLAWDDDTIDDPAGVPVVLPPVDGSLPVDEVALAEAVVYLHHPIAADVRDELVHRLTSSGYPTARIARIARTTPAYVTQIRAQIRTRLDAEKQLATEPAAGGTP
jgi:hypothetical protein